jgi:hypothetical protein
MNQNLKITYTYQHKETGDRLQRTFTLSEIKAGEDDAHLVIIPGYEFISMSCPLCEKFAIGAAALSGGLKMRGEPGIPDVDFFAKRQIQQGVDMLTEALNKWHEEND